MLVCTAHRCSTSLLYLLTMPRHAQTVGVVFVSLARYPTYHPSHFVLLVLPGILLVKGSKQHSCCPLETRVLSRRVSVDSMFPFHTGVTCIHGPCIFTISRAGSRVFLRGTLLYIILLLRFRCGRDGAIEQQGVGLGGNSLIFVQYLGGVGASYSVVLTVACWLRTARWLLLMESMSRVLSLLVAHFVEIHFKFQAFKAATVFHGF